MLTLLIATHNGAYTLPRSLAAHCQLVPPAGGWRLVIVDNGSTDATSEIISSFTDRLPLTYLLERARGKNAALNAGLNHAEGDLVLFTDDDTLPRPDWLIKMREVADRQSSFAMFGGAVVPHWEVPPADWILKRVQLAPVFSITDPELRDGPIPPSVVYGTNMAVRAEIFRSGRRFDTSIGPRGGSYAMGSETELAMRLTKEGFKSYHCEGAVVEHIIRDFQMRPSWILGRAIRYGRGRYRLSIQHYNTNRKKVLGVPGYLLRELRNKSLDVVRAKLRGDAQEFFERRWIFNYLLGQAIEAHALHKELTSSKPPNDRN
jgi:L-malate glycosyltransferase